jgi:hypothetical protein
LWQRVFSSGKYATWIASTGGARASRFALPVSDTCVVRVLRAVHAAIGLGQQVFGVSAVSRVEGLADAYRNQILAANGFAYVGDDGLKSPRHFCCGVLSDTRGYDYELVTAHPRCIVIFAARVLQSLGEHLQQLVSLEVTKTIVHLLESVEV